MSYRYYKSLKFPNAKIMESESDEFHFLLALTFFKEQRLRSALDAFSLSVKESKRLYVTKTFRIWIAWIQRRSVESKLQIAIHKLRNTRLMRSVASALFSWYQALSHMAFWRVRNVLTLWASDAKVAYRESESSARLARLRIITTLTSWSHAYKLTIFQRTTTRTVFCVWNTSTRRRIYSKRYFLDDWIRASSNVWELSIGTPDERELFIEAGIALRLLEKSLRAIIAAHHRYDSAIREMESRSLFRVSREAFGGWTIGTELRIRKKYFTLLITQMWVTDGSKSRLKRCYKGLRNLFRANEFAKEGLGQRVIVLLKRYHSRNRKRTLCDLKLQEAISRKRLIILRAMRLHYGRLEQIKSIRSEIEHTLDQSRTQRTAFKHWRGITHTNSFPNYC